MKIPVFVRCSKALSPFSPQPKANAGPGPRPTRPEGNHRDVPWSLAGSRLGARCLPIAGGRLSIRPVLAATRRTYAAGGRSRESGRNFFDRRVGAPRRCPTANASDLDVRSRADSHFSDTVHSRPPGLGKSKADAGGERAKPHQMRSSAIDEARIALLPTGPDVGWVKSRQISRSAPRSPRTWRGSSTENVTISSTFAAPSVAERSV